MNQLHVCILLAISLYGLIYNSTLLYVQLFVIGIYSIFALYFRMISSNTPYSLENSVFWKDPKQGIVMGRLEICLDRIFTKFGESGPWFCLLVRCYAESMRRQNFHKSFFFGNLKKTEEVDVCVMRRGADGKFAPVLLKAANRLSVAEIQKILAPENAPEPLETQMRRLGVTSLIPAFLLQMLTKMNWFVVKHFGVGFETPEPAAAAVFYDLSLSHSKDLTQCHNDFNDSIAHVTVCQPQKLAVVEGDQVVVKNITFLNNCLDHRYLDGSEAYAFLKTFVELLDNFEQYL